MLELSAANAPEYLRYPCQATPLGGGVSNTVLLIEAPEKRFVVKQSLGKLRVEQDWFSDRRRIYREASAMRQLALFFQPGGVPEILFEDRENFLFAMSAAPKGAEPWKDLLLRGEIDPATAATVGQMLHSMIACTAEMREEFADQAIFDQLRLDPYYRSTALRHPDLAPRIYGLIERSTARRIALVHGDWSPKNFLVCGAAVMAIDFEVIHYGDPSFDAAFLLNHLLLKSWYRPRWWEQYYEAARQFWLAVDQPAWFERATIEHLGGLLLARIDGKSPAEYVREPELKEKIRRFARAIIIDPPDRVLDVWRSAARHSPEW